MSLPEDKLAAAAQGMLRGLVGRADPGPPGAGHRIR